MACLEGVAYVAPQDPLDCQASLAPLAPLAPRDTQGSSLKVQRTCSALPSAHQALPGHQECQGSRVLLATRGSKERPARMVRRVTLGLLGLLGSRALLGYRAPGDLKDFQGHLDPLGTGVL